MGQRSGWRRSSLPATEEILRLPKAGPTVPERTQPLDESKFAEQVARLVVERLCAEVRQMLVRAISDQLLHFMGG
jgi:hypothetical protein